MTQNNIERNLTLEEGLDFAYELLSDREREIEIWNELNQEEIHICDLIKQGYDFGEIAIV